VAQSAIIVTGAVVRLTGSGLGCPTWPQCTEGSFTPTPLQAEGFHKWIEFANRLLTFILAAIAIAVFVYIFRKFRSNTFLIMLGALPLVGTIFQAVLGGITVLTALNPFTVLGHFLVSILLVALSQLLIFKSDKPAKTVKLASLPQVGHLLVQLTFLVGLFVIILGAITTGAGPHSGDSEATRFTLDIRTIAWLHADTVSLFIGLLIGAFVLIKVLKPSKDLSKFLQIALIISLAQAVVGYSQWFAGLPWALVGVHVALAVLLWIFLVKSLLATRDTLAN
jgi:cytochrome c oxidase assembly protein subunit 15